MNKAIRSLLLNIFDYASKSLMIVIGLGILEPFKPINNINELSLNMIHISFGSILCVLIVHSIYKAYRDWLLRS